MSLFFVHEIKIKWRSFFCLQVMELQEAANKQWEPPADGKQP